MLFTFAAWSSSLTQCWATCCNSTGIPRANFSIDFSSNRSGRFHPSLTYLTYWLQGTNSTSVSVLKFTSAFIPRFIHSHSNWKQTDVSLSPHQWVPHGWSKFLHLLPQLSLWHHSQSLWRTAICHVISDHNLASSVTASHKSLHISWPCRFFLSHTCGRWPSSFFTQLKYVLVLLSLYCGYYILVSEREVLTCKIVFLGLVRV